MKRNTLFSFLAIAALGATTALGIVKATPAAPEASMACTTYSWNSTSSTVWSNADNWTTSGVPGSYPDDNGDKAVILSSASVDPLLTADITVGSLHIQNNRTVLTGAFDLTITGAGDCDGIMDIDSGGTLNVQANGSVILVSNVTHPVDGILDVDASGTLNIQDGTVNLLGSVTHPISGVLDVDASAILDVQAGTVDMDSANTHPIDGQIWLSNNGSTLKVSAVTTLDIAGKIAIQADGAVLDVDANVTVQGAGQIKGENNGAQIQIVTNKDLRSTMSTVGIVGKMKIVGPGTLDNRGVVLANLANGTLELGSDLLLADTSGSGRWEASGQPTAVLLFSNAHTCALKGGFRLGNCATIQFNVDIDTEGPLTHDSTNNKGTIDMENGATFGYDCNTADPCVCTDITSDTTLGCP